MDTLANSASGSGDPWPPPAHRLRPATVLATHPTNKVIPLTGIARARLHGGITPPGMTMQMTDGTRHKLLWLSSEPARRVLRDRLLPVLWARPEH
ncbi:hypothetical protein [Streptomyces justiciae]|uniref:Uncharacterized protein n=1 Tax=Streptomyces justiciae TaxID=2780140 RepID=A0ABU3M632_9ACTN|nr:hypothetical protein [Streptomyces justiciae]MDT7846803.1 hypothetical protein [Streptomyces justiciae]